METKYMLKISKYAVNQFIDIDTTYHSEWQGLKTLKYEGKI